MTPPVSTDLSRKKQSFHYLKIPLAIGPVPHGELLPAPEAPQRFTIDSDDEENVSSASSNRLCQSRRNHMLYLVCPRKRTLSK